MKKYYKSIWISDTHLSSMDCKAEAILDFLNNTKSDNLYLVGDIFDIWQIKRRWYWPPIYNSILQKIIKKAKHGTKVYYIPGNHDEFFRDFVGHKFGGIEICSEIIHETVDGKRFLVTHGDQYDVAIKFNKNLAILGSAAYDYIVWINRFLNKFRWFFGLSYWSLSTFIKNKVKNAIKYITCYEEILSESAKSRNLDGVICGHIHQPCIYKINDVLYCNCGEWVEACTALVEDEQGELSLVRWSDVKI